MPYDCPICGSQDYDEQDGLYFCTECGTQSQEMIVQELEDGPIGASFGVGHEVRTAKKPKPAYDKKEATLGRPWTIYEGFQFIIVAQAEALVELGADPSLKETVFMIWANYLSAIGVAFCKEEKVVPDIVSASGKGRLRELHRGSFENPLNFSKANASKQSQPIDESSTETSVEDLEDLVERGFVLEDDEAGTQAHHSKLERLGKHPEWMSLPKTLGMCYIGLMITNPNILPCDVIRWVYAGQIPYLSATHTLPEDMMFSSQDEATFNGEIDTEQLLAEVNRLMRYFRLGGRLRTNWVETLIGRFIQELYLPDELRLVCCNLVRVTQCHALITTVLYKRQEILAMAFIITGLRMIYRLDDQTEQQLSKHSEQIQEIIGHSHNIFIWHKWKIFQMHKKQNMFCPFNENIKDISSSSLQNLDPLLQWHSELRRDERKLPYSKLMWSDNGKLTRATSEFKTSLKKPLKESSKTLAGQSKPEGSSKVFQRKEALAKILFPKSTISHIVDCPHFRQKVQHCDKPTLDRLEATLQLHQPTRVALPAYTHRRTLDESVLEGMRHREYMWLLRLCSQHISPLSSPSHNGMFSLDVAVIRLQEKLQTLSHRPKGEDAGSVDGTFDASMDLFS